MSRRPKGSCMRILFLALPLILSACAVQTALGPQRLHTMPHDKDPNQSAICMAPNGENVFWRQGLPDPATGEALYTCPAPAFFVPMPRCAPGEDASLMDETPEARALRVRFGRDGSFHGDSWQGRRFCMPASPH